MTNDQWSTGNFRSREELLSKSKENNINTRGKFTCKGCGSNLWAIAFVKILFIGGDAVFCQVCGKPGPSIKELRADKTSDGN